MNPKIELLVDKENERVILNDGARSTITSLFSGCRVNFLFGAGFSANILGILNNNEVIFEALQKYQAKDENERKKVTILTAFMYWSFFNSCIKPISEKTTKDDLFDQYKEFGNIVYRIFSERGNPSLDRQFNIFTTNYDPIIELIFDHSNCICNDGFEGRIQPRFSTDNYSKTYYRHAMFSNRKVEIPSVNLFKLHGSVTWENDDGDIIYQHYCDKISAFFDTYLKLFNNLSKIDDLLTTNQPDEAKEQIKSLIDDLLTANQPDEAKEHIKSLFAKRIFDTLLDKAEAYDNFIKEYKKSFLIVNPTKEKFSDTLLNKNYYELLRIFSNELEKENTLMVANGFSFRDEHILDLVKRSMVNPYLKILIFVYQESEIEDMQKRFGDVKNNNITYIALKGEKLSLTYFNQILSHIHS